jgi:hypothetical protein
MARETLTFIISLPPEIATDLERVMHEEHRTRSALIAKRCGDTSRIGLGQTAFRDCRKGTMPSHVRSSMSTTLTSMPPTDKEIVKWIAVYRKEAGESLTREEGAP